MVFILKRNDTNYVWLFIRLVQSMYRQYVLCITVFMKLSWNLMFIRPMLIVSNIAYDYVIIYFLILLFYFLVKWCSNLHHFNIKVNTLIKGICWHIWMILIMIINLSHDNLFWRKHYSLFSLFTFIGWRFANSNSRYSLVFFLMMLWYKCKYSARSWNTDVILACQ